GGRSPWLAITPVYVPRTALRSTVKSLQAGLRTHEWVEFHEHAPSHVCTQWLLRILDSFTVAGAVLGLRIKYLRAPASRLNPRTDVLGSPKTRAAKLSQYAG